MNKEKYVFSQLVSFLDRNHLNDLVRKYNDDKYVKHLTCWNQFLAMMFRQLSNRESLRDLIVAFEAHHSKCYHLGMGKNVLSDCIVEFTEYKATKDYPKQLRLVRFFDEEQGKEFAFLTNATHISSSLVAELYKNRWQIELFFKWLKQHLKIKKFWGI